MGKSAGMEANIEVVTHTSMGPESRYKFFFSSQLQEWGSDGYSSTLPIPYLLSNSSIYTAIPCKNTGQWPIIIIINIWENDQ